MSVLSDSYRRAEKTTVTIETAVQRVSSAVTHGTIILLNRLGFGFFGAAYVCMVLLLVLIVAVVLGVGLVQMWGEEPVLLRERLHFDYSEPHPRALFSFGGCPGFEKSLKRKPMGVPVGHTFSVSVALLMPESGFNREIGVFQLSAEVPSNKGHVIRKSSLPCMLRFRSLPVQLARTFIMSIPLVLGITGETQKITIEILKHKEVSNLSDRGERETLPSEPPKDHPQMRASEEENDVSELLRKWRRGRSKRMAIALPETVGSSSASTFTITREETSAAGEEDVGDSESVTLIKCHIAIISATSNLTDAESRHLMLLIRLLHFNSIVAVFYSGGRSLVMTVMALIVPWISGSGPSSINPTGIPRAPRPKPSPGG
ncbi:Seipin family [Trema orientale]|uniref:Seipin family n=1 Tax=Trema orientale TaxID=63057 RepID=A0A2P5C2H1_TREOI|nr:Seipin family [Trema orientale]